MSGRRDRVQDLEKALRDELISGLTEVQTWVGQAAKRLSRLDSWVREEITMEQLARAFGEEALDDTLFWPDYVILHHSTTRDGATVSWDAIRRFHTRQKGWNDIGYHFGVETVNDHVETLLGRIPGMPGAHCLARRMNAMSVGVCVIGNFDVVEVPNEKWQAALRLVRWICGLYRIEPEHVLGHREVASDGRTCPGRQFDMGHFRSLL